MGCVNSHNLNFDTLFGEVPPDYIQPIQPANEVHDELSIENMIRQIYNELGINPPDGNQVTKLELINEIRRQINNNNRQINIDDVLRCIFERFRWLMLTLIIIGVTKFTEQELQSIINEFYNQDPMSDVLEGLLNRFNGSDREITFNPGETVIEPGEEPQLVYVKSGSLKLLLADVTKYVTIPTNKIDILNGMALFTNKRTLFNVIAKEKNTKIIRLSIADILPIITQMDFAYEFLGLTSTKIQRIEPYFHFILLHTGQALYKEGDSPDSYFILLNGHLRSVKKNGDENENIRLMKEFKKCDIFGHELFFKQLDGMDRITTVFATRESIVAKIDNKLHYMYLVGEFGIKIKDAVDNRMRKCNPEYREPILSDDLYRNVFLINSIRLMKDIHTLAIVPTSNKIPILDICHELQTALEVYIPKVKLFYDEPVPGITDLNSWLEAQENVNEFVVYQCYFYGGNESRAFLRRADAIFVVTQVEDLENPPFSNETSCYYLNENELLRTRKDLVFYNGKKVLPENRKDENIEIKQIEQIQEMFANVWFCSLHHIHDSDQSNDDNQRIKLLTDFARLARFLSGNAIGLALGGGGAKGAVHLAIIEKLIENKIPIDMIGGTSIGSMMSGLYAKHGRNSIGSVREHSISWFKEMGSNRNKIKSCFFVNGRTSSIFSDRKFVKLLKKRFSEKYIEDLLVPYFCVSADIGKTRLYAHNAGILHIHAKASMSYPVAMPVVPYKGGKLVDGGVFNNLPADIMNFFGARHVILVDLSTREKQLEDFHLVRAVKKLILSTQKIQRDKIYNESSNPNSYISHLKPLLCVNENAREFDTFDFKKFDDIYKQGCNYFNEEKIVERLKTNADLKQILRLN